MTKNRQKLFVTLLLGLSFSASANVLVPNLPASGVVEPDNNKTMSTKVDYSNFTGRVTDKDDTSRVLKVHVENNNTKFFRAGDPIKFWVNTKEDREACDANVRGVEDFYFIIYVKNFENCYGKDKYFRRGTVLKFQSDTLSDRVFEASRYRELLILRKDGFMKQLSDINHFLWTYEQQKMRVASEYDEKINELVRQKQLAIDRLLQIKEENLVLQTQLQEKLDSLDENMDYYRVERSEYITDRWNMDHDAGLPFGTRPQKLKER